MTSPRTTYLSVAGLEKAYVPVDDEVELGPGYRDTNDRMRQSALTRAHQIRQFEIELYWKRATYFWVLQAAVFAAVGVTWKFDDPKVSPLIPLALAALGSLTGLASWLSAMGSKFWQENWEHHIDMLEDDYEGRLHKTAYVGGDGIAWSVSGVNDRLAICFGIFWSAMLATAVVKANPSLVSILPHSFDVVFTNGFQTAAILIATFVGALSLWSRRTSFKHAKGVSYHQENPTFEGSDWLDEDKLPSVDVLAKLKKPFLVRREPKI